MKAAAVRIHALMSSLGFRQAEVVGHDIGLMVAYAYTAMYPAETTKLVVMDAFLPGVAGWEAVYNNPGIWHFRFNGPTPEALVRSRERIYFDYFWNDFADKSVRSPKQTGRLTQPLCAAWTDESGLGLFRLIQSSGEGFCAACEDPADNAGPGDRWGEIAGRGARRTDEVGGARCDGHRAQEHGPLDSGGEP